MRGDPEILFAVAARRHAERKHCKRPVKKPVSWVYQVIAALGFLPFLLLLGATHGKHADDGGDE